MPCKLKLYLFLFVDRLLCSLARSGFVFNIVCKTNTSTSVLVDDMASVNSSSLRPVITLSSLKFIETLLPHNSRHLALHRH